jgi:hypothetical protein
MSEILENPCYALKASFHAVKKIESYKTKLIKNLYKKKLAV